MVFGNYSDLIFKRHAAVLGIKLAEDLGLGPGDQFSLIRQNKSIQLKVVGLIKTGTGSDQTLIYLPLQTAQDILGQNDVVSEVGVRLSNIYAAPSIASDLNSRTHYKAESWQEQNKDTLQVLDTQDIILYIFTGLILVIAGFGVANTMIMNVMRRTKEIGILMAMGTTRQSIVRIFLLQSLILGPPAALLGIVMAYLAANVINASPILMPSSDFNMVFRMTVVLTFQTYILAVVFALITNFLAGIYPAYKASKLDPVEAIGS
jgi:lipoprotein-releasing system permease protein